MPKKKNKILLLIMLIPLLLGAVSAFAQIPDKPPETIVSKEGLIGVIKIINNSSYTIYELILIIAVVFILFSAFTIMTAGGDENKFKKGKAMLRNTIFGLVIALLAVSIILVTISIFDLGNSSNNTSNSSNNSNNQTANNFPPYTNSKTCQNDTDCSFYYPNSICKNGSCILDPSKTTNNNLACKNDKDCGANSYCVNNFCIANGCSSDDYCQMFFGENYLCMNSYCKKISSLTLPLVPIPTFPQSPSVTQDQCQSDDECRKLFGAGWRCSKSEEGNVCFHFALECKTDTDCTSHQGLEKYHCNTSLGYCVPS